MGFALLCLAKYGLLSLPFLYAKEGFFFAVVKTK
jgi:hypothetical protein